jgi:threonylcarbamoyladenosine tRNA methylthiotransferase MtaB
MHRPYRQDDFRKRVLHILERMPHAAVGADVLIGFPGETDHAFENTFRLLDELPLAYLHVFPFSARKGTPAAEYPDHVPQQIIKERCRRTRAMGVQKKKSFIQRWLYQDLEVLVEDSRDAHSGMLTGVTSNYIKVLLTGEDRLQNTFQKVHLEALADERTLFGRLQSSCHLSE